MLFLFLLRYIVLFLFLLFQLDAEAFIQSLETEGTWNEPQAVHLAADTFKFRPVIFVCPDTTDYDVGTQSPKLPTVNITTFDDLDQRRSSPQYFFICDQDHHWRVVVPTSGANKRKSMAWVAAERLTLSEKWAML